MKNLQILFIIIAMPVYSFSQDTTSTGIFEGAANSARMLAAKHEFNVNNMRGALTMYRDIIKSEPENAGAHYWSARCHYKLKRYDLAHDYLDKAVELDPSVKSGVEFFYGEINHRLARLDEAISYFLDFLIDHSAVKVNKPDVAKDLEVMGFLSAMDKRNWNNFDKFMARKHIQQCVFARQLMAEPLNVSVENMGNSINSRFDDYTPSVSADGSLLIFTSRRSDTQGGAIDEGGDYKYFEDIYYAEWDAENHIWSKSIGVNGKVNSPTYDAVLSLAPQGDRMFIYRNNRESAGDIFESVYDKHSQEWNAPTKLPKPINTSYYEGSVSITADEQMLYFISERPEGEGQGDIYFSTKKGEGWSSPKNLGEIINTDFDEKFVFIHPNGRTLYFSSNGHQTMGGYDIFKSELVNGKWAIPVNLGYPINTVNEESTFSLTRDNKTMYIAAEYADSFGERDIYKIDVTDYPLISQGYDKNTFGTILCTTTKENGDRLKNVEISVYAAIGERVIASEKSDKFGVVRFTLPGNQNYRVVLSYKGKDVSRLVQLDLKPQGETLLKLDVSF